MRILYLAAESANWVISLCNELCKLGNEVTCVVQESDEYDKENKIKEHRNLTRINVPMENFFSPEKMKTSLISTLSTRKFDIVFGSHAPVSPSVNEIGRMLGIPWGVMLLDIPFDLMTADRKRLLQWMYWFDVLKYANTILFNTHIARDVYYNFTNQFFQDSNIITYGTAFPKEMFNAGKDIVGDYVVSISRLTPMKAVSSITRALAKLKNPPRQVVIGRDRGDLQNIMETAEKFGVRVEYKEMVSEKEKYELIKNSAMVIYPQETEFIGGLSPWEGMYLGKQVIVKDYPVLKHLYGDNVHYVAPKDDEALAKKILEVYNFRKEHLKNPDVFSKFAKQEASFKTMAKRMNEEFKKLVI